MAGQVLRPLEPQTLDLRNRILAPVWGLRILCLQAWAVQTKIPLRLRPMLAAKIQTVISAPPSLGRLVRFQTLGVLLSFLLAWRIMEAAMVVVAVVVAAPSSRPVHQTRAPAAGFCCDLQCCLLHRIQTWT